MFAGNVPLATKVGKSQTIRKPIETPAEKTVLCWECAHRQARRRIAVACACCAARRAWCISFAVMFVANTVTV
jgi:hypothetical protein